MPLHVITGTQWGDEGKGRIVDWYARGADFTARGNGGDNAGHTVTVGERIYKLHLIPSGILHPQVTAVLGNGMVINPQTLLEEMEMLRAGGLEIHPKRLRLSHAAHIITPAHRALDQAQELQRGKGTLGTTGRGIGPAYTDKASRRGLRLGDMLTDDFPALLEVHLLAGNAALLSMDAAPLDIQEILAAFAGCAEKLAPYIADTALELSLALQDGKKVIAEGAQGTLLDIDFGTYPFVTSSSTTAAGALTGLGLGLDAAQGARLTGVVKAFQTRVGTGPFPTEVTGDLALRLRGSGSQPWDEYGTTTGRARRVGWLDIPLLRYALRVNGIRELAVTKLDVLSGMESLRLCIAYEKDERRLEEPAFGPRDLALYQPIYEDLPGWKEDVQAARQWADLPVRARTYLGYLERHCGVPIKLVSVGAEREQVIEIR